MCLALADKFRLTFILVSLRWSLALLGNLLQLLANFQKPNIFWMPGFFKDRLFSPSSFKKLYHSRILATLVWRRSRCWVSHKKSIEPPSKECLAGSWTMLSCKRHPFHNLSLLLLLLLVIAISFHVFVFKLWWECLCDRLMYTQEHSYSNNCQNESITFSALQV